MERHPDSAHLRLGLDELEALKSENDVLAERDNRDRPEVCEGLPSFLTVGNTHKCNLTCQMCFKQLDDVENMTLPDMGLERFERIAHELFPHVRSIALSVTGEPLVSRAIFDELDLMATYGVRGSLTSNGMPLSRPGLIERLLPATKSLTISMDGASEPIFNAIRRRANFKRTVKNIQLFNAARDTVGAGEERPRLHFNHILQWRNVAELPQLIELAHHLNVDFVHVDHVYVFENLNPHDSLQGHRNLTNRKLEEARAVATRLNVELVLPDPFDVSDGVQDEPYELHDEATLLAQGRERLPSVRFDPEIHERWSEDRLYRALVDVRKAQGGNREYVEHLLGERALLGHLQWGIPQLDDSLIPAEKKKVSACTYAWRESFIEYNGLVAPCCNPSMSVGRIIGHLDEAPSFREIWNGETYRRLRKSLTSGSCYRFCRTCYLFEPVNEAAWGTDETWFKVETVLDGDAPAVAGQVPAGKRLVLTEVRSSGVNGSEPLQILSEELQVAEVAASRNNGSWHCDEALEEVTIEDEQVIRLRCVGARDLRVELTGYVV